MTAAHTAPYRIRAPVVRDGLAGQFGTENGPVAYARFILAPGPHAAVAAAQVVVQNGRRAQAEAGGDSSGAGVAEVREGEVAAEQMRRRRPAEASPEPPHKDSAEWLD
mgnify:FL=1